MMMSKECLKPTVEMPAMTRARLAELTRKDPEVFTRPTVRGMAAVTLPSEEPLDILDEWIIQDPILDEDSLP